MKQTTSKGVCSRSIAWVLSVILILSPLQAWANTESNFKIGETYSGFNLIQKEYIGEIDSEVRVFEHGKSGARLIHINNSDTNKVFSINFRTPPSDDTGIPHILEHSLLNGSKNFPLKSPFAEMLKRSLSTFLNALTYADRTSYPVSSRNSKDFRNLMHVYLDAVFYPNILKEEKIFKQEGWNYALNDIDDELIYNGVVYNEMKGNFSNPITVLFSEIQKSLLPDTPYAYNSGGNPEVIPNLTYEGLVSFYQQYYHPSNSYIYLYGNLDLLDTLAFIDKEYLSNFEKKEIDSAIPKQNAFNERIYTTIQYSLPEGADAKNKSYLSLNFVVDEVENKETMLGFQILNSILTQTQSSPLRNALLQARLGTNFYGIYNPMQLQPSYGIVVENVVDEQMDQFESIVENTLKDLVINGIDRDLVDSVFKTIEISLRTEKSNANRGLSYNDNVMLGWLYDHEPTLYLTIEDTVQSIKGKIDEGFFEGLILTYLLDNPHSSLIVMEAVPGLDAKKTQTLKTELKQIKAALTEEEIKSLVTQTKELREWKDSPDTKEALQTLPTLSLDDLQDKTSMNDNSALIEKHDDYTLILSPLYTNKIAYINLYFDTTKVPQEQLSYISLMVSLLGNVDTESYNYMQLTNELNKNFGGIGYQTAAFGDFKDHKKYQPKLVLSMVTVADYIKDALSLVEEVITKTQFEDVARLQQLTSQIKAGIENNLSSNGLSIATSQLGRRFSNDMEYLAKMNGLDYYYFLREVEELLVKDPQVVIDNLYEVMKFTFQKENLLVGVTLDEEEIESLKAPLDHFISTIDKVDAPWQTYSFTSEDVNEGIINGEKIQYVAQGYNYKDLGYEYSGSMDVLSQILSMEYLWNNVRVRGGAYGGFANISNLGHLLLVSYRDPNLKETLDVYNNIPEFLRTFNADEEKMLNYIIGTLGQYDPLIGPQQKGSLAERFYIVKMNEDYIDSIKKQILNTSVEDIREFAKIFDDILAQNYYTVVGNETKLAENANLFDTMLNIFGSNRTISYHPVRQVFEYLGATVNWDGSDVKQPLVIVEAGNLKMVFYVNTPLITINGQEYEMQGITELRDGITHVPEEAIEIFINVVQQLQQ